VSSGDELLDLILRPAAEGTLVQLSNRPNFLLSARRRPSGPVSGGRDRGRESGVSSR
jgi:hypothetical protein